jgi:hypothetical protein
MKRLRRILKRAVAGSLLLACCFWASTGCTVESGSRKSIEDFESTDPWRAVASDQVSAALRVIDGIDGKALCLDYDFNGVSGHAGMRRRLPLHFPDNYVFDFQLRGKAPINDLEFKLIDASGDNVWWVKRPKVSLPVDWENIVYRKRHVAFAWGPIEDRTLRTTSDIEFTVYSHEGGRGEVCFDELAMTTLPSPPSVPPRPVITASSREVRVAPDALLTGHDDTVSWRSGARGGDVEWLSIDFGIPRELGGLVLRWHEAEYADRYDAQVSDDGETWRSVRKVAVGNGGTDALHLTEVETRYVRLRFEDGPSRHFALSGIEILPPMSANGFFERLAHEAPRGRYPRGFVGEQSYWTVVGIDGGLQTGLLSEDGAIEAARGGFSIEPFLIDGDRLISWADVAITPSLADGYLPIPTVRWRHGDDVSLSITAFAEGNRDNTRLLARYVLRNDGNKARTLTLALAIRPFQVNPPVQFLNTPGGVSPIHSLSATLDGVILVDGKPRLRSLVDADAFVGSAFDAGMMPDRLLDDDRAPPSAVEDATGFASGALLYRIELPPGSDRTIALDIPLVGAMRSQTIAANALPGWLRDRENAVADTWREKLGRVRVKLPIAGQPIVDTLRTALAHVLINRHGVEIRPGTRSYGRSWIRDGTMTSEALLRMGHKDAAADFLRWYAPFQFRSGKVPCCVDYRGSDPVPENDSHGELIHLVGEVWRYGRDRALLESMWSHVDGAVRYMDELRRSERTEANLTPSRRPRYGLMPPSISHEGYSAKPAYSYWDDFWALTGYKQAVRIAQALGREEDVARIRTARDEFHGDLLDSIGASAKLHDIDFIPGAAELGDFDATSTTIALSPAGEQQALPQDLLRNTFERYWREFVDRRDGRKAWDAYTPYELRNVGAFVRLGWRDRAHEALSWFFEDRRPVAWNQWAEVVGRVEREPRFIGDMPHGWVASDFIRSVLDFLVYDRASDDALVLAAGIPDAWLDGEGVAIENLRTPHGLLSYALRHVDGELRLSVADTGLRIPPGGIVLPARDGFSDSRSVVRGNAEFHGGEWRIDALPAEVRIGWPARK